MAETETERPLTMRDGRSAMGRSTVIITCPWCQADTEAYVWSLAGSGKRCVKCGALHTYRGISYRRVDKGSGDHDGR